MKYLLLWLITIALSLFQMAHANETTFKSYVQKAGYDNSKQDELGPLSYDAYLAYVEHFPWKEQAAKTTKLIDKGYDSVQPTIGVINSNSNDEFFISGSANDQAKLTYQVGLVRDTTLIKNFGLNTKKTRLLTIYNISSLELATLLGEYFYQNDFDKLDDALEELTISYQSEVLASY